jgi:hypothetical protein
MGPEYNMEFFFLKESIFKVTRPKDKDSLKNLMMTKISLFASPKMDFYCIARSLLLSDKKHQN